jgi:hypothetical protein
MPVDLGWPLKAVGGHFFLLINSNNALDHRVFSAKPCRFDQMAK